MSVASADQRTFTRCIRLVIADRHPVVLRGLKSTFAPQSDFEVVASCSSGSSCIAAVRKLAPDVVLLANTLPDLTAAEILAIAKAEGLSTRLVFFTESETDDELTAAIASGACSSISKYASPETLLRLLRPMAEPVNVLSEPSPDLAPAGKEVDGAKFEKMLAMLTDREREIMGLVSEGLSNKAIARQLNVSQGTVKVHLHNIFQKLEINNRTVLAAIALLQRPVGFGTLSLAALAFATMGDVKASDPDNTVLYDDSIAHNDLEHGVFELWTKWAILHHIAVGDSAAVLTQRSSPESRVTDSATRIEELRAAHPAALSNLARDCGATGSGTPYLFSPPAQSHGGHGIFAMTAAGVWTYALSNGHAHAQALDLGQTLTDTFTVAALHGTTQEMAVPIHGPSDAHLNSTRFDTIIDFTSGTDKINLAAFGALAFLHLSPASTSVPPHTLAWTYNPASNETIVYVNPTDGSLDVGDAGLLEIHLQGVVSVAESDFVYGPDAAAVAAALEGIDPALLVTTASDGTVLTTGGTQASIGASVSESAPVTADQWTMPTDDGLRFHFWRDRVDSILSVKLAVFGGDAAHAPEESDGAVTAPAHVSSIELAHSHATVLTEEKITSREEPTHAGTGAITIEHAKGHAAAGLEPSEPGVIAPSAATASASPEIVEPGDTKGNGGGHGNSQHASQSAATKAADAAEQTEPDPTTSNGGDHGNSQHASHSAAAKAADAAELTESDPTTGNSGSHGNSQHASQSAAAKAADAAELTEPDPTTSNSGGHGNSQHAPHSAAAKAADAAELTDPDPATGNSGSHGNSQHAPHSAAAKAADAAELTEPDLTAGNSGSHGPTFHFNNHVAASNHNAAVEPYEPGDPRVLLGHAAALAAIEVGPAAGEENVASHLNNGQHNSMGHSHHELLV